MLYQMIDVENDKEPFKSRQNTIIDDAKRGKLQKEKKKKKKKKKKEEEN